MLKIMSIAATLWFTGCRTTPPEADSELESIPPGTVLFEEIDMATWESLTTNSKSKVEIGCVCEEKLPASWSLYRYARTGRRYVKISLNSGKTLDDCILSKFVPGSCELKF